MECQACVNLWHTHMFFKSVPKTNSRHLLKIKTFFPTQFIKSTLFLMEKTELLDMFNWPCSSALYKFSSSLTATSRQNSFFIFGTDITILNFCPLSSPSLLLVNSQDTHLFWAAKTIQNTHERDSCVKFKGEQKRATFLLINTNDASEASKVQFDIFTVIKNYAKSHIFVSEAKFPKNLWL